jgi:hypothetical protein
MQKSYYYSEYQADHSTLPTIFLQAIQNSILSLNKNFAKISCQNLKTEQSNRQTDLKLFLANKNSHTIHL